MDAYLADANKPGQHQTLLKQVERFRDVGKIMSRMEQDHPDEAPDMLRLAFAAIRAGLRHTDIRYLKKIFVEDRVRYNVLVGEIEKEEKDWDQAGDSQLVNPDLSSLSSEDDDDGDDAEEAPGPVVTKYPTERVKEKIRNTIDGFVSSQSISVYSALVQVWNRLEPIDAAKLKAALNSDASGDLDSVLTKIVHWVSTADSTKK